MSSDLLAALATKANLADVSRTLSDHSRTLGNKANVTDMSLALDSKVNRVEVVDAFNRPMANIGDVHALANVRAPRTLTLTQTLKPDSSGPLPTGKCGVDPSGGPNGTHHRFPEDGVV
jgi:hypothetical protein